VTVLDPCTGLAAICECRCPRSPWCIRRGGKYRVIHLQGHDPVARRRDHRLPFSKRAVSILVLWCTLNACMSMVGLH